MSNIQTLTVIALKGIALALTEMQREVPEGAVVLENLIAAQDNLVDAIQAYYAL